MRTRVIFASVAGLGLGLVLSHVAQPHRAQSQEASQKSPSVDDAELDTLKASATGFEEAFNAGDARAIGALFAANAEAVDEEGTILLGREAIEARFAELFQDFPKARIEIALTSLRRIGPDVAVEDGFSTTTLAPEEPGSTSPYTIVHVKRDGNWQIGSVRDFPEVATAETAHEQLQSLAWLAGHWVDESPDGRVETDCRWSDDGNYLLQDYVIKTRRGAELRGTQRIAWDPRGRTVRSWAFDQSGAFTQATWTPLEHAWILRAEGVTPDGRDVSVTRVITPFDNDSFQIDSTSLVVGNELLADSSVRVVRRPPIPSE